MEHIRSLSDERETLTMEVEAENEQLKSEIGHLKEELEGTLSFNKDIINSNVYSITYGGRLEFPCYIVAV